MPRSALLLFVLLAFTGIWVISRRVDHVEPINDRNSNQAPLNEYAPTLIGQREPSGNPREIRVRLRGIEDELDENVILYFSVANRSGESVEIERETTSIESRFDVTDFLSGRVTGSLQVEAYHPLYVIEGTEVALSSSREPLSAGLDMEQRTIDVYATSSRQRVIVPLDTSRVESSAGGEVSAYRLKSDLDLAQCERYQKFGDAIDKRSWRVLPSRPELRIPNEGWYLILVTGSDHLTEYRVVHVSQHTESVDPFLLKSGACLSGTVKVQGEAIQAGTVTARPLDGVLPLKFGRNEFRLIDGALCPAQMIARVGLRGEFRFGGILPTRFKVSVSNTPFSIDPELISRNTLYASAPSSDLAIAIEGAVLDVVPVQNGRPQPGVEMELRRGTQRKERSAPRLAQCDSDEHGHARFIVSPFKHYQVAFGRPRISTDVWVDFTSGSVYSKSSVSLPMFAQSDMGHVELRVDSQLKGRVEISDVAGELSSPTLGTYRELWTKKIDERTWSCRNLIEGRWELVVHPAYYEDERKFLLPTPVSVEVLPGAAIQHEVRFRVGGQLELSAHNEEGEPLQVDTLLFDSSGEQVGYTMGVARPSGRPMSSYIPGLKLSVPYWNGNSYAAGAYVLRVMKDGYQQQEVDVQLRALHVTQLNVVMKK